MKNVSVIVLAASIAFMAGAGLTYVSVTPWISDMANQVSIKTQERPFLPPPGSVPSDLMGGEVRVSGGEPPAKSGHQKQAGHEHGPGAAASSGPHHDSSDDHHHEPTKAAKPQKKPQPHDHGALGDAHDHSSHSHGPAKSKKSPREHSQDKQAAATHGHHDGMASGHAHGEAPASATHAAAANPVKPTPASVRQGEELFNVYCAVCHGPEGRGGMPMEKALAGIPKFTPQLLRRESDPHMFSMVSTGHGPMPGYAEALKPEERWHVVNYLRTLQDGPADRKGQNSTKGKGK